MVNSKRAEMINTCLTEVGDEVAATRMSNLGLLRFRVPAIDIAQAIDKTPAAVSLYKTGKRKISDQVARDIEQHFGLDEGWMDDHHFAELPDNFGTQGSRGLPLKATAPKDVSMQGKPDDVVAKERMALRIREAVQRLDFFTAMHVGATFFIDEMTDDQRRLFAQWFGQRYNVQTGEPLGARSNLEQD